MYNANVLDIQNYMWRTYLKNRINYFTYRCFGPKSLDKHESHCSQTWLLCFDIHWQTQVQQRTVSLLHVIFVCLVTVLWFLCYNFVHRFCIYLVNAKVFLFASLHSRIGLDCFVFFMFFRLNIQNTGFSFIISK